MIAPPCTVVVGTRHRPLALARCLEAIARCAPPATEIVVVDNSEGDARIREVAAGAGARYAVEPRIGISRARNLGASVATAPFVAFIDDDAVPDPGWLDPHLAAFADPSVGATTGRVLASPADSPVARVYAASGGEDLGERGFRIDRSTPGWFERTNFGGTGVGPNMVFRRALFERGWGFRVSLGTSRGLWGEENYAFFTLVRDGHAVVYTPESVVHHDAQPTMEALRLRHRKILRDGAAYALMLLVEERAERRSLLEWAWRGVRGRRRTRQQGEGLEAIGRRRDKLFAALLAPVTYIRWRLRWRGNHRSTLMLD